MLRPSRIEKLLQKREMSFFKEKGNPNRWMLPFECGHVLLTIDPTRGTLLMRTSSLVDLSKMSLEKKAAYWQAAMANNDRIRHGRFVGYEAIHFEVSIHFPSGVTLTEELLFECLNCTIATLYNGREGLETLISELPSTMMLVPGPLSLFAKRTGGIEQN